MSGLVLIQSRDGAPLPPRAADSVVAVLAHRGPDGRRARHLGSSVLVHLHDWTTPEEVGEDQPVEDPGQGLTVAFDGRVDNRPDLLRELDLAPATTDAQLVLAGWRRWQAGLLDRLVGPFALIVIDRLARRTVLARDPLGERGLAYHLGQRTLVVASEASACLAHPEVGRDLDRRALSAFYAFEALPHGASFFSDVSELPAGHALELEDGRVRTWQHWRPRRVLAGARLSDLEAGELFRKTLAEAVRARLRARGPVAVMMSGGLDSTSVAALAARELDARGERLQTISWVFDTLPTADERRFIEPMVQRWGLDAALLRADDDWPLRDGRLPEVTPSSPLETPYTSTLARTHAEVRRRGGRTLLTGDYGDHLYAGWAAWLRDLLAARRVPDAVRLVGRELRDSPRRLKAPLAQAVLGRHWRTALRRGSRPVVPWLREEAAQHLVRDTDPDSWVRASGLDELSARVIGPWSAHSAAVLRSRCARSGVDMRRPYRDRRVVELALELPAHLVYRPGWWKWVLRVSMGDLLPEPVRWRHEVTSLTPLFVRGLVEREAATVRRLLETRTALWRRYIRPEWLSSTYPDRLRSEGDSLEAAVVWRCVLAESWNKLIDSPGFAASVPDRLAS